MISLQYLRPSSVTSEQPDRDRNVSALWGVSLSLLSQTSCTTKPLPPKLLVLWGSPPLTLSREGTVLCLGDLSDERLVLRWVLPELLYLFEVTQWKGNKSWFPLVDEFNVRESTDFEVLFWSQGPDVFFVHFLKSTVLGWSLIKDGRNENSEKGENTLSPSKISINRQAIFISCSTTSQALRRVWFTESKSSPPILCSCWDLHMPCWQQRLASVIGREAVLSKSLFWGVFLDSVREPRAREILCNVTSVMFTQPDRFICFSLLPHLFFSIL